MNQGRGEKGGGGWGVAVFALLHPRPPSPPADGKGDERLCRLFPPCLSPYFFSGLLSSSTLSSSVLQHMLRLACHLIIILSVARARLIDVPPASPPPPHLCCLLQARDLTKVQLDLLSLSLPPPPKRDDFIRCRRRLHFTGVGWGARKVTPASVSPSPGQGVCERPPGN